MPNLEDISYSRDETVAAVRDYYKFLTKLYLEESMVIEPPENGWPTINPNLQCLGKTDEVISLLSYLPYIREPSDDRDKAQGAPSCYFADWQNLGRSVGAGRARGESLRVVSESASIYPNVPQHVIGLTAGGRSNPVFLLDTKLGIVHWYECPGEIGDNPAREQIQDDPYDYAPEEEAEWRAEGGTWAISDFFEVLKEQFRRLNFVPLNSRVVMDVYTTYGRRSHGMIPKVQDIYREHGWSELERYNKRECLEAVQNFLEEQYPDYADRRDDE